MLHEKGERASGKSAESPKPAGGNARVIQPRRYRFNLQSYHSKDRTQSQQRARRPLGAVTEQSELWGEPMEVPRTNESKPNIIIIIDNRIR
jgi:hypothetical protein